MTAEIIPFWRTHENGKELEHGHMSQWYRRKFKAPILSYQKAGVTIDPHMLVGLMAGLSQLGKIDGDEIIFSHAEQYMMLGKALVCEDYVTAIDIMKSTDPKEQKSLGRKIRNFDEDKWAALRLAIVTEGNFWKYKCNEDIRTKLMAQWGKLLVEASPYDKIWGVGLAPDDPKVFDQTNWKTNGKDPNNQLGEALMKVQQRFRTMPVVHKSIQPWMPATEPAIVRAQEPRVALMVGRFQPLHAAHCLVIDRMCRDNDVVIVCIGSAQEHGTERNPYHFEVRKQMIKEVYGDRVIVIPVKDLGLAVPTREWIDNILGKIEELRLPSPNRYYCGSFEDSFWYQEYFAGGLLNPSEGQIPFTGAMVHVQGAERVYRHHSKNLELHVMNRKDTDGHYASFMSGTEVRQCLAVRSMEYTKWVPERNIITVEANYPAHLRVALECDDFDDLAVQPDGTYCVRTDEEPAQVYQKRNGKWMPERQSMSVYD